ncbi:MAG: hypothetical protein KDI02_27215, partial [Anaerolineae bacterium]|nr:hypothetical protein [Anaerolineae bacterium]
MASPTQRPPASNPTAVERFDRSLPPVERDLGGSFDPHFGHSTHYALPTDRADGVAPHSRAHPLLGRLTYQTQ